MGLSASHRQPSRPANGDIEAPAERHPLRERTSETILSEVWQQYGKCSVEEFASLAPATRDQMLRYWTRKFDKEQERLLGPNFDLSAEKKDRVRRLDDAIQPHTDEGGDANYIGYAYVPINPVFAKEWEIPKPGPYLEYIKKLSPNRPHLEYLSHWMEVTAAPPKWKFLRRHHQSRTERASRTKACVIDYSKGVGVVSSQVYHNAVNLRTALDDKATAQNAETRQVRLIIVEDLSRDVVETLGERYDVDPLFFVSQIGDYLFHNTRDRWVELPSLDVDARKMPHFTLQYLRARYYGDEADFDEAECQSGLFNVLRRLDSDRSRKRFVNGLLDMKEASVALGRAKTSLWVKPRKPGEPITAILLVDPTINTTKSHPLWGGYRPFETTPSMRDLATNASSVEASGRKNLFDDVVYWSRQLSLDEINNLDRDPKSLALPMCKLVIADWLAVLKYMTTMLGTIEWEFEKPHWGEKPDNVDKLLKKLSPWRRNVGYYEAMINEAIARLFPPEIRAPMHTSANGDSSNIPMYWHPHGSNDPGIPSLWTDFHNVQRQMHEIAARIKNIEQTATNAINIEEARRAVEENRRSVTQNKNLARLTFLATIFIPLNFTSSFLSISNEFSATQTTFWLFFAIAAPLTIISLLVVDLSHPGGKGVVMTTWRKLKLRFSPPQAPATQGDAPMETIDRAPTSAPWALTNRLTMRPAQRRRM